MTFLLLMIAGYLLSHQLLRDLSYLERLAYSLLFTLAAVPWIAINISLIGPLHLTDTVVLIAALVAVALLVPAAVRLKRRAWVRPVDRSELIVLALALPVALFAWHYHSDTEFILSLASFQQRGEAECFYMQTFQLLASMNPETPASAVHEAYHIINSPGNALFTAPLMPIFGAQTFHVLYVLFVELLFLFVFLVVRRLVRDPAIAIAVALFAVLNPYMLSIEVLDRNLMALALTAALFHALLFQRNRPLLHGLLFGVVAGSGLQYLPLLLALPALLLYRFHGARPRAYIIFVVVAAGVFAFNVPQFFVHGLGATGETAPLHQLTWDALSGWARTPFVPYPNALLYPMIVLSHLGLLFGGLILLGAITAFVRDRRTGLVLTLAFVLPLLVLAVQRDWLESDKARILLSALLPLLVFLGHGIDVLARRKRLARSLALLAGGVVLLAGMALVTRNVSWPVDASTYERRPLYQRETPQYVKLLREHLTGLNPLPSYGQLFLKTDLSRKAAESAAVARSLSGPPPVPASEDGPFVDLRIDIQRLVTQPDEAVTLASPDDRRLVDLEDREHLLDVYYKEIRVSWQAQRLPVAVFPRRPEVGALDELYVDCNAYIGFGQDEYGFERVNPINLWLDPATRKRGKQTGMTALPQRDQRTDIVLRVPRRMTVIVRNWIVDGRKGTPHRVDSWSIALDGDEPELRFHPGEPESYL